MKKPIFVANWKMYKNIAEVKEFFEEFVQKVKHINGKEILICPSSIFIETAKKLTDGTNIAIGAQDMHWERQGAYTGNVSVNMIQDFCEYVIIGHSERRKYDGDTDERINLKLHLALGHNLKPILCIGEELKHMQMGETEQVLKKQLEKGLEGIEKEQAPLISIAYEPVWAIGTGISANPEQEAKAYKAIRQFLSEKFGDGAAEMRLLYGGSVNPENIAQKMEGDIDGVLVGGASLNPDAFSQLVDV